MNTTKGPWNIFKQDEDIHIFSKNETAAVATLVGWNDDEEGLANANLISASPDLYKALKGMIKLYEKLQPAGGYQGYYDAAVMAIEKANPCK